MSLLNAASRGQNVDVICKINKFVTKGKCYLFLRTFPGNWGLGVEGLILPSPHVMDEARRACSHNSKCFQTTQKGLDFQVRSFTQTRLKKGDHELVQGVK